MNHATRKMRYFADRLIEHEATAGETLATENEIAVAILQKLRPQLVDIMGNTGFHALVARSLALAHEEVGGPNGAWLSKDGNVDGLAVAWKPTDAKPSKGGAVMLAWLLGLLNSFIGELLTMQMVLEVWPELPLNGYFSQREPHEKT